MAIAQAKKDILEAEKISAEIELGKAQSNFTRIAKNKGYGTGNVNYSSLGTFSYGNGPDNPYGKTSEILKSILDSNDFEYLQP